MEIQIINKNERDGRKFELYFTNLNYLFVNVSFQIFFDVKGKGCLITKNDKRNMARKC